MENATSPVVAVRASQGSSSSDGSAPDSGVPLEEPRTPPLPEKQEAVNPSHKVMRTVRLKVSTHAILLWDSRRPLKFLGVNQSVGLLETWGE